MVMVEAAYSTWNILYLIIGIMTSVGAAWNISVVAEVINGAVLI